MNNLCTSTCKKCSGTLIELNYADGSLKVFKAREKWSLKHAINFTMISFLFFLFLLFWNIDRLFGLWFIVVIYSVFCYVDFGRCLVEARLCAKSTLCSALSPLLTFSSAVDKILSFSSYRLGQLDAYLIRPNDGLHGQMIVNDFFIDGHLTDLWSSAER